MTQPAFDCVATIGFFDGVHRGHLHLIGQLIADALSHHLASTIVTFRQHPRQVLVEDYIPQLLTTEDSREELLRRTGVDHVVIMDFTPEVSRLSSRDFMAFLQENHGVRRLLVGYDHHFGHDQGKSLDDYVRFGQELGIAVVAANAFTEDGINISSSVIRRRLSEGNIRLANKYLGRLYDFSGLVVHGRGEGRRIGFPTANLLLESTQVVPCRGVYAVNVRVEGIDKDLRGMMNIGLRPTFGESAETVEVHIFEFDQDIYDCLLTVQCVGRLRNERKFDSTRALVFQLNSDRKDILEGKYE